jgi:hypothetical protein
LALDILAMIYVLRRKHTPRTYENLKQREELRQNRKRKSERFNRSWNYVFFLGLLGLIFQILIQIVDIQFFGIPSLLLFFAMMFYFIRGFKGKYASTSQEIKRLISAILGFILMALPLLVIVILLSLVEHGK